MEEFLKQGLAALLQTADALNVVIVIILTRVARPWVTKLSFFSTDEDRLMIVPVTIGVFLGFLIEWTTPTFALHVAIRRSLACGCGAAMLYRFWRMFFGATPSPEPADS